MDISSISGSGPSASIADRQLIADNLDTFLQLLTTQLRNQDPLEPIDTNEFTAQLVQFSQVEQSVKSNSYLETLVASQALSASQTAVGYIGKVVTADGATTQFESGEAQWAVEAADSGQATFTIRDAEGTIVFTHESDVDSGQSLFTWDGSTSTGQPASDGLYTLTVVARDPSGQIVPVSTKISGIVRGAQFDGSEPMLDVGGIMVRLASVTSVEQPPAS